ncbi:hypothetical protein N2152v2_008373 [Parachlorella kessleri]
MGKVLYALEKAAGHYYRDHPECPERVAVIGQYLNAQLQLDTCPAVSEPTALRDPDDPDGCTFVTPSTWQDAFKAASLAVALVDAILDTSSEQPSKAAPVGESIYNLRSSSSHSCRGEGCCGFSICRPPGHHATPSEALGFCFLNNAALAARHAQRAHGLQRVMIVDWDVHHGNGTQDIFYEDPSVLFVDIHQANVWPESGSLEEAGAGAGQGATINVPLPWYSGHSTALRVFDQVVAPAARRFQPQLIIVSAGYDAHWRDPLEKLAFQSATYHWLAAGVVDLARELCSGRCLLLLEGGYDKDALAESVGETMRALLGQPPSHEVCAELPGCQPEPLEAVEAVIQQVRDLHGL